MPTREQVLAALRRRKTYEDAAADLGIPAGQAYMVATGVPADGSDAGEEVPEEADRPGPAPRPGAISGSTQHLVNPPASNPTRQEHVLEWVARRAAVDRQMRSAADARTVTPPTDEELPREPLLTDELTRQHNESTYLTKQLQTVPGRSRYGSRRQVATRGAIADQLVPRLRRHDATDQRLLWPLVLRTLPDGEEWQRRSADLGIPALVDRLAQLPPDTTEFDETAGELIDQCRRHAAMHDRIFRELAQAVDDDELRHLGVQARDDQ